MSEPTRQMPNPILRPDGNWEASVFLTPTIMNTRARFFLRLGPAIPIILVPGIMGTNLRAKRKPQSKEEKNLELQPGEVAWRAPNGAGLAMREAALWEKRKPVLRQLILDGPTLEVDDTGDIDFNLDAAKEFGWTKEEARGRWWGEVHADSYGSLLYALEVNLNHSFEIDPITKKRSIRRHWQKVMAYDPARWGVRSADPLTEAELVKHAKYQFPVYAVGYNWLKSCSEGAARLEQRIAEIRKYWTDRGVKCDKVILVTHSMGGLVARACAKRIPDQIAGVIHGVMPALGAPACYRRIACGTEDSSPSNGRVANMASKVFARIAGETTDATTAVMATSPGALQLLPNHRYPRPWMHVGVVQSVNNKPGKPRWLLSLPSSEDSQPYNFYRDTNSWYRLINPALADPAGKYKDKSEVLEAIADAIDKAERFHMHVLDDYYHPNTYAFYGADPEQLAFGQIRWLTKQANTGAMVLTPANVTAAQFQSHTVRGARTVQIDNQSLSFEPQAQDIQGDGTVPQQSGAGPASKVKQVFETRGYSHQSSYHDDAMLALTHYLIVKIVQGLP